MVTMAMKVWIIVISLMYWVDKSNETQFYHLSKAYDVPIKSYKDHSENFSCWNKLEYPYTRIFLSTT